MRIRKEDILQKDEVMLISAASDALAHPARVEIFHYIYRENMALHPICNKDLVAAFDYSQATISQHVSKLASAGLLDVQKKETRSYYYVNLGTLGKYLDAVKKLRD